MVCVFILVQLKGEVQKYNFRVVLIFEVKRVLIIGFLMLYFGIGFKVIRMRVIGVEADVENGVCGVLICREFQQDRFSQTLWVVIGFFLYRVQVFLSFFFWVLGRFFRDVIFVLGWSFCYCRLCFFYRFYVVFLYVLCGSCLFYFQFFFRRTCFKCGCRLGVWLEELSVSFFQVFVLDFQGLLIFFRTLGLRYVCCCVIFFFLS